MPERDIERIKPAEAQSLASILRARLGAEQMIGRARERSISLLKERKQAAYTESLAILTDGCTIHINGFSYG